jgi:hypothetical protein
MLVGVACAVSGSLASRPARADEHSSPTNGHFALDLGGVRHGFVRAAVDIEKTSTGQQHLVLTAQELTPSLAAMVDSFTRGVLVKRDIRLTSGAVVRKANDARLVSAKLPSLGAGGSTEIELGFDAPRITTQPLLSAKEAPPSPASTRIAGFRLDLTGLQAIDAPKIDAITVTQRTDGAAITGELGFDVAAGGAPPFLAWQKASPGKGAPRAVNVEYIAGDGAAILKLHLDRCVPTAVKPMGASGTTRITLACTAVRGG